MYLIRRDAADQRVIHVCNALSIAGGPSWAPIPWQECAPSCGQFVEQGLRLLQVQRVKALGEPAVDRAKKMASLAALTLFAPEPSRAHCSAQISPAVR